MHSSRLASSPLGLGSRRRVHGREGGERFASLVLKAHVRASHGGHPGTEKERWSRSLHLFTSRLLSGKKGLEKRQTNISTAAARKSGLKIAVTFEVKVVSQSVTKEECIDARKKGRVYDTAKFK